jgi:hypothetical protein
MEENPANPKPALSFPKCPANPDSDKEKSCKSYNLSFRQLKTKHLKFKTHKGDLENSKLNT